MGDQGSLSPWNLRPFIMYNFSKVFIASLLTIPQQLWKNSAVKPFGPAFPCGRCLITFQTSSENTASKSNRSSERVLGRRPVNPFPRRP